MQHRDDVKKYSGSLADLAKDIGNMRYDSLAYFLKQLGDDLIRQAAADKARGRVKLASQLEATAQGLYHAREKMIGAWEICSPYMERKEQKNIK